MDFLIFNVTIFTNDENVLLEDHAVVISEHQITDVLPKEVAMTKYPKLKKLDGHGRLLMPGLINSHMHSYWAFLRGFITQTSIQNYKDFLASVKWKFEAALDLKAIYYCTLHPVIHAIKHGVTSVIEHHSSCNAIEGSLDKIEEAFALLGLRGILALEISDSHGKAVKRTALEENARFVQKCQMEREGNTARLFEGMIGLHASFALEDQTLRQAAELSWSTDRGCHVQVMENEQDRIITNEKYNVNFVKRLVESGVLSDKSIAAHCQHLTHEECDLLAASGSMVVHCLQSDKYYTQRKSSLPNLSSQNILVGLGTDGLTADIKQELRFANLLHNNNIEKTAFLHPENMMSLFLNNYEIFQRVSGFKVGKIKRGWLADLILVDYCPPTIYDKGKLR